MLHVEHLFWIRNKQNKCHNDKSPWTKQYNITKKNIDLTEEDMVIAYVLEDWTSHASHATLLEIISQIDVFW